MLTTLALITAAVVSGLARRPADPAWTPDVVYTTRTGADGRAFELRMNIAAPPVVKGGQPRAGVLLIHGGGWTAGRREDLDGVARTLAAAPGSPGLVAATVSYRFAPTPEQKGPERAPWPAQYEDVAEAVRFLKAHAADYGMDPNRLGAVGFSAGAHLAMMLAVGADADGLPGTPEQHAGARIRAAVSFVGPTDLLAADIPQVSLGIIANLVGPGEGADARRRSASPLTHVSKGDAPILMFFGTKDPLVPHTQAYPMLTALTNAGVQGRAEILLGEGHGFRESENTRALAAMRAFLDEFTK